MTYLKNLYEKTPSYLKNKYVIIILLFIVWIIFFDNYNLIRQSKIKKEIKQLEENKSFYTKEIKKDSTE